jgi:hypothetical protein
MGESGGGDTSTATRGIATVTSNGLVRPAGAAKVDTSMQSDALEPAAPRLVGAFAGRYTVRGVLGRGGMATVYLADDVRHGRRVALKVLDPELGTAVFADRFIRAALELNPAFALAQLWAGQALEMLGRFDEAVATLQRAVELSGDGGIFATALARTLALSGGRAEAERRLTRIERDSHSPAYEIARVYTALGRRDEALAWLERAYAARSHAMVFLRVDPQLAALRGEPKFRDLLGRMRL